MTAARNMIPALCSAATILIATPNPTLRKRLGDTLRQDARVDEADSGAEALSKLEHRGARIVVLDRNLPDLNSDELIGLMERQFPCTDVVLLDSVNGVIEIPEDLRANPAYRCLQEFNLSAGRFAVAQPHIAAFPALDSGFTLLPGMVGSSEAMRQLAASVRAVARHSTSVLISGETGSGKELVAEAVHKLSARADKPFITINCAAIPETLIEAELFGHARGAFTGAVQSRLGKIHAAHGGTIFFDEIGELLLSSQSKLLRFLECGEVQRLGTSDVFRLDARVVAATNVDLERRVHQGLFREDLFYRLSVFPIELAPLRERSEDILPLARHFIEKHTGSAAVSLSPESETKLLTHAWPGNVRELRNVIERAFVLAGGRSVIGPEQILLRKPCASVRTAQVHATSESF